MMVGSVMLIDIFNSVGVQLSMVMKYLMSSGFSSLLSTNFKSMISFTSIWFKATRFLFLLFDDVPPKSGMMIA